MPENENANISYSTTTALVYVFNLIVGTGALALPGAVERAGWLPSVILILLLGFISYITVTFLIETLAVANHVRTRNFSLQVQNAEENEGRPLLANDNNACETFEIKEKFEFTELASTLLSRPSRVIVAVCLIVYLFGDLSIYCAVMARTLTHTTCFRPGNASCNATVPDTEPCWESLTLTRLNAYQIYVTLVGLILTPLVFLDLQKTKWLQFLTSCIRWCSFVIMIGWSLQKLFVYGPQGNPVIANAYALPTLFGSCVYSFMCHHSIPSLIQPITNKPQFAKALPFNYVTVAIFYIFLSLTAVWTFNKVEDLYTLNFWTDSCNDKNASILFLDSFLALFPVFTLSTSFPIIAITLRNNLRDLLPTSTKWLVPLVTGAIPMALALSVPNLQLLVGVVGSYAGVALQYVAPMLMVQAARSRVLSAGTNPYQSPFSSRGWIWAVSTWATLSIIFISLHHITSFFKAENV